MAIDGGRTPRRRNPRSDQTASSLGVTVQPRQTSTSPSSVRAGAPLNSNRATSRRARQRRRGISRPTLDALRQIAATRGSPSPRRREIPGPSPRIICRRARPRRRGSSLGLGPTDSRQPQSHGSMPHRLRPGNGRPSSPPGRRQHRLQETPPRASQAQLPSKTCRFNDPIQKQGRKRRRLRRQLNDPLPATMSTGPLEKRQQPQVALRHRHGPTVAQHRHQTTGPASTARSTPGFTETTGRAASRVTHHQPSRSLAVAGPSECALSRET